MNSIDQNRSQALRLARTQNRWYPVWLLLGLSAVMTPAIVLAASGGGLSQGQGFDAVVRGIESRYHAHPTHIPLLGLVSGIAAISTKGAVHNLHIANFENFSSDSPVDGDELLNLVEQRAGSGWERMIRETSRSGNDQTLIYVRPEGKHIGMMVIDLDGKELDVVQISMSPDQLLKQIEEHDHHHLHFDTSHQDDAEADDSE